MLNSNHPDDERLSALASRDTDATADALLTAHLSTCDRCTDLVNELGALRASLAHLPDLQPSRPLRLLPAADEAPAGADRLGGWARRFFAPVLTAGAARAMVGLVGTTAPALDGMASGGGQAGAAPSTQYLEEAAPEAQASAASEDSSERAAAGAPDALADASDAAAATDGADGETMSTFGGGSDEDDARDAMTQLPAERSPWPMVLFTGVALMVAAALLRWILVPRAG